MHALTDDEAALLYHVQMFGPDGYPVERLGMRWVVRAWRSVKGPPVVYKTKREAIAQFELWLAVALDRWRDMKRSTPSLIITGIGIKNLAEDR